MCSVLSHDGLLDGSSASASITIGNSTPEITSVSFSPSTVYTNDTITASATYSDADGETPSFDYIWTVNGSQVQTGSDNTLAPSFFNKGETVAVSITADDGDDVSTASTASVSIGNTVPTSPQISLSPTSPTEGQDDLICTVDVASSDDDEDALVYTYEWYDPTGSLVQTTSESTATSDTFSGSNTSAGTWECFVYASDGEDNGAAISTSVSVSAPVSDCQNGANLMATAPGNDMVICDDPTNSTCEEDFETLCPVDWHLCSQPEYNNRNDGWNISAPGTPVGTRYCRWNGGAGHFTLGSGQDLSEDEELNCHWGTSRPTCTTGYGCNETQGMALCCAPHPSCGNGVVDSPEENCDDGDNNDDNNCMNNCDDLKPGPTCN